MIESSSTIVDFIGNPNYRVLDFGKLMNEEQRKAYIEKLERSERSTEKIRKAIAKAVAL